MTNAAVRATEALRQRLRTVAGVLLPESIEPVADEVEELGLLSGQLIDAVLTDPDDGRLWLLMTALTGTYPLHDEYEYVRRMLELDGLEAAEQSLIETCLDRVASGPNQSRELELVTDRPVVEAHFSATDDLLTGIQRVVRNLVPLWLDRHQLRLAAWSDGDACLRTLTDDELIRLGGAGPDRSDYGGEESKLVVPWRVPVILLEVPAPQCSLRLSALARHSNSPLVVVGYDCIPVISGEFVLPQEHEKFVSYLSAVKYARKVVGISAAAADEFRGFTRMLGGQGLSGPDVAVCVLPNGAGRLADEPAVAAAGSKPTIVCIGSIDRRKNQIVVLEAAEHLWRSGASFALRFMGSGGHAPKDFVDWSAELRAAGRPLTIEQGVSDAQLAAAVRGARFTVFVSLHEGYGLPVAESLGMGVPVITSDLGAMREIAQGAGGLLVDPTDPLAVADAMRRLLADDALRARLVAEAQAAPRRQWPDYAAELWHHLVGDMA